MDRFCDPSAKEQARKEVFERAIRAPVFKAKAAAWLQWLSATPLGGKIVFAQLQSRLMVNMAGGVMENAGLCIDRFGLPYIPGSAVKGCARRTALAALREWCEAGGQLENKPKADENPLTPCCENFGSPADMLAAIARVFGWCELDWADSSDLRWACNDQDHILAEAAVSIANHFHWPIKREHEAQPWRSLPNFGGSVSFLPAYPTDLGKTGKIDGLPLEVPPLGKLELDVVTCHHRQYYEGKLPTATDTEEPVPVVFPAVAPGHVFTFALAPLRGSDAQLLELASVWLKTGLQTFGLGAKTNAGYGWFVDVTPAAQPLIAAEQERLAQEAAKKAEQARLAAEAAAKAAAEAERLAKAPPHERFCAEYAKLADEPFATQAKKFAEMNDEQRHGFVLALKQRRDTAKRWAKKKPELLKPWQEFAQKLQPPIQLP
ncbi:MAG: type III-B CRISPR module RAMP protein Cmr6 [Verrucomicrobiae bacterium]|nr:type III-B CRISPR module RAMP protein Cmr6 [Verrucomicrobiae bacterium]